MTVQGDRGGLDRQFDRAHVGEICARAAGGCKVRGQRQQRALAAAGAQRHRGLRIVRGVGVDAHPQGAAGLVGQAGQFEERVRAPFGQIHAAAAGAQPRGVQDRRIIVRAIPHDLVAAQRIEAGIDGQNSRTGRQGYRIPRLAADQRRRHVALAAQRLGSCQGSYARRAHGHRRRDALRGGEAVDRPARSPQHVAAADRDPRAGDFRQTRLADGLRRLLDKVVADSQPVETIATAGVRRGAPQRRPVAGVQHAVGIDVAEQIQRGADHLLAGRKAVAVGVLEDDAGDRRQIGSGQQLPRFEFLEHQTPLPLALRSQLAPGTRRFFGRRIFGRCKHGTPHQR